MPTNLHRTLYLLSSPSLTSTQSKGVGSIPLAIAVYPAILSHNLIESHHVISSARIIPGGDSLADVTSLPSLASKINLVSTKCHSFSQMRHGISEFQAVKAVVFVSVFVHQRICLCASLLESMPPYKARCVAKARAQLSFQKFRWSIHFNLLQDQVLFALCYMQNSRCAISMGRPCMVHSHRQQE